MDTHGHPCRSASPAAPPGSFATFQQSQESSQLHKVATYFPSEGHKLPAIPAPPHVDLGGAPPAHAGGPLDATVHVAPPPKAISPTKRVGVKLAGEAQLDSSVVPLFSLAESHSRITPPFQKRGRWNNCLTFSGSVVRPQLQEIWWSERAEPA